MAIIRENYWIEGLRQLMAKVISKCHECKRFQSKPSTTPSPGYLPETRTEKNLPFKVIGADYASQIYCETKSKREEKVYILFCTCSVSRTIHLENLNKQATEEFIKPLKKLVARRGRSQINYSDNAKTFTAAEK